MPTFTRRRFRQKDFTTWLSQHTPDQPVGGTMTSNDCPLARFLAATALQGCVDIHVYPDSISWDDGGGEYQKLCNPLWAETFVRKLDNVYGYTSNVTAVQCQDILTRLSLKRKKQEEESTHV